MGFQALGRPSFGQAQLWAGQMGSAKWAGDPLNNNILKSRDLMVNSKVFGNCKKRNNFVPILS
jgi:hypothetical protein